MRTVHRQSRMHVMHNKHQNNTNGRTLVGERCAQHRARARRAAKANATHVQQDAVNGVAPCAWQTLLFDVAQVATEDEPVHRIRSSTTCVLTGSIACVCRAAMKQGRATPTDSSYPDTVADAGGERRLGVCRLVPTGADTGRVRIAPHRHGQVKRSR